MSIYADSSTRTLAARAGCSGKTEKKPGGNMIARAAGAVRGF